MFEVRDGSAVITQAATKGQWQEIIVKEGLINVCDLDQGSVLVIIL